MSHPVRKAVVTLFTAVAAVAIMAGCGRSQAPSLHVEASFTAADYPAVGSPVFFNGETVGKIDAVDESAAGATLHFSLDQDRAAVIQNNALAILVGADPDELRVELRNPRAQAGPLADGDRLQGIQSRSGSILLLPFYIAGEAVSRVGDSVSDAWQNVRDGIDSLLAVFRGGENDADAEEIERSVNRFVASVEADARSADPDNSRARARLAAVTAELDAQKSDPTLTDSERLALEELQTLLRSLVN